MCYRPYSFIAIHAFTASYTGYLFGNHVDSLFVNCVINLAKLKDGKIKAQSYNSNCFFQLRHLRRIDRSLDDETVVILVHVFITSRVGFSASACFWCADVHNRETAADN